MNHNWRVWASRILAGIITVALTATASLKIAHVPKMVEGLTRAGIPEGAIVPIAILELACLTLYLIPRTMVLGAVLLTGYFGGAMVVHIIGRDSVLPLIMIGAWTWGGIYFRVPGLRALLPLRRESMPAKTPNAAEAESFPKRRVTA